VKYNEAYRNALLIQRIIVREVKKEELAPKVLAMLARAFCEIIECKRKLLNQPLVKAVDVRELRQLRERVIEASSSAVSAEEPGQLAASETEPANTAN
jgi:hypothetical protein